MLAGREIVSEIDKSESKKEIKSLHLRLAGLQRQSKERGTPVIIIISGPSASGKGRMVSELLKELDPRGYKLHTAPSPPTDDIRYPFFRRYWYRLPANGTIGIFIDNWYRALFHRFKGFKSNQEQTDWCNRINTVERQLTDSGARIFKFYLNISKKEQKRRLKKLAEDKNTSWRITSEDKQMQKGFNKFLENADKILENTHTPNSPWTVLPADNGQLSLLILLRILISEFEKEKLEIEQTAAGSKLSINSNSAKSPRLDQADLSLTISREEYENSLSKLQSRLQVLHNKVYRKKIPVIIAYEGWDAAGKGGNIKRLAHSLDPRGYEVLPIGAPSGEEKFHHYLWRFWKRVPRTGHIAIFDRTWYGRVLVEKVEGFCTPEECERAYSEILEMEHEWSKSGIVLLKFWIHIDKDEQLRRFKERENSSHKKWKITDEDWRNREKWGQYCEAVDQMLQRTHSSLAPWTVVESNCKLFARIKVLKTVVKTLESHV